MTELPPIIERLDALLESDAEPLEKVDQASRAYDELRALVLRLQEEQDDLLEVAQWWESRTRALETRIVNMRAERDALLEALQVITEQARDGWRDTESSPAYHFERIQDKALDAMANVEGKDE